MKNLDNSFKNAFVKSLKKNTQFKNNKIFISRMAKDKNLNLHCINKLINPIYLSRDELDKFKIKQDFGSCYQQILFTIPAFIIGTLILHGDYLNHWTYKLNQEYIKWNGSNPSKQPINKIEKKIKTLFETTINQFSHKLIPNPQIIMNFNMNNEKIFENVVMKQGTEYLEQRIAAYNKKLQDKENIFTIKNRNRFKRTALKGTHPFQNEPFPKKHKTHS